MRAANSRSLGLLDDTITLWISKLIAKDQIDFGGLLGPELFAEVFPKCFQAVEQERGQDIFNYSTD